MVGRPVEHEGMGRDGAERRGLLSSPFLPFLRKSASARPRAVRFPKKIAGKLRSRERSSVLTTRARAHMPISNPVFL